MPQQQIRLGCRGFETTYEGMIAFSVIITVVLGLVLLAEGRGGSSQNAERENSSNDDLHRVVTCNQLDVCGTESSVF